MPYDIGDALKRIENILLRSMSRNLIRHVGEERDEGFDWTMWQAEQLSSLGNWSRANVKRHTKDFTRINNAAMQLLQQSAASAETRAEQQLLQSGIQQAQEFFHVPDGKMESLLNSVRHDLSQAERSILRQADDVYRKAIFDTHVYLQSGSGTLQNAIQMAVDDLNASGIRSIVYKNGNRVEASAYARMALRTANVRARMTAEGKVRDKNGIHTILVPPSGIACKQCAPWLGKVLVDDVYCSGTAQEASALGVPLLSEAIRQGFLHPQCNCSPHTYVPGISKMPEVTDADREEAVRRYGLTQKQRYNERQIRRWKAAEKAAPDEAARKKAAARRKSWQQANKSLCDENPDILRRDYEREKLYELPDKPIVPEVIEKAEEPPKEMTAPKPEGYKAASANDPKSMEDAPPTPHTREELDELVAYAAEQGLNLVEVERFDGDLALAREQFDLMGEIKREYKIARKLSVKFAPMYDGDLGYTPEGAKSVELNLFAFRSRAVTNAYLNSDNWLSSTDTLGIGAHEMGHVISAVYGEKGLDIARRAYYNIYKREISYQELIEFLTEHVSIYAARIPLRFTDKPFKPKFCKEVVPEVLAKHRTNPDVYTAEFVKLLKEACKL